MTNAQLVLELRCLLLNTSFRGNTLRRAKKAMQLAAEKLPRLGETPEDLDSLREVSLVTVRLFRDIIDHFDKTGNPITIVIQPDTIQVMREALKEVEAT